MERYIQVAYQQQLANVEDGSLVLLIGDDKKSVPAIKGVIHGKVAATVLTKIVKRFTGEETRGPLICFPENADCLVLGKEFLIDFDPTTVEFRPDGKWELGLLAVDAGSRMYIHAHSREGGQTFVALDTGGAPNRTAVAVFRQWSLSIRRINDDMQELYRPD